MRSVVTIILIIMAMVAASCGGGSTTTVIDPGTPEQTAAVDGYLTQGGISDHAVSAADSAVEGAEIWCEDPGSGEVLGQDATDASGYFNIDGLPAGEQLNLRFRFRAEGGLSDVEGEQPLNLDGGEQRRLQMRIRQLDADGDGETDAVDGEATDRGRDGNLNCNMRRLIGDGEPPLPELDAITDLLLDVNPNAEMFPPLPLDEDGVDDRGASELAGDYVVLGPDFMRKFNGEVTDNSLVLNPGDHRLAWGLYKIGGLEGQDIASLSVECAPLADDGKYFIGVSNYSRRHWEWSGPVIDTEYTFEVRANSRHVSPRGNVYFLIAVFHENSCEFFAAQANPRDIVNDRPHPRAPIHLEASDGKTENGVMVHWRVAPLDSDVPIDSFVVMRATTDRTISAEGDDAPQRNFEEIGTTTELEYFDETALEGVVYLYAVIAVSGDERSGHSNADRGFWAVIDDPVERYPLAGMVVTEDGAGVGGVMIQIAHGDRKFRTITGPDGHFVVRNLPAGWYSVTPHKRGASFDPEAARVELPMGDDGRLVFVATRITEDGNGDGGNDDPGNNPR